MILERYNTKGIQRGLENGLSDGEIANLWDVSIQDVQDIREQITAGADFLAGTKPAAFTAEEIRHGSACPEGGCS